MNHAGKICRSSSFPKKLHIKVRSNLNKAPIGVRRPILFETLSVQKAHLRLAGRWVSGYQSSMQEGTRLVTRILSSFSGFFGNELEKEMNATIQIITTSYSACHYFSGRNSCQVAPYKMILDNLLSNLFCPYLEPLDPSICQGRI